MNQEILSALCSGVRNGGTMERLFPRFQKREIWRNIAEKKSVRSFVEAVFKRAASVLAESVPVPRLSDAFRFQKDGNRRAFEKEYFARRDNLSILVLACVLSGEKERYFAGIVDYLGVILEERFWCVPAHAFYGNDGDPRPLDSSREYSDLFASATAAQIGLTVHLLGDELREYSPGFLEHIRNVTLEHTILPLIEKRNEPWWLCGRNNWTPWCSQNLLTAGICLLDDKLQFEKLLTILWNAVERFWNFYPEDGYCDEGPSYWGRAGSELIVFLHRLNTIQPGSMQPVFDLEKFANIVRFPEAMQISGNLFYTFADGIVRTIYSPGPFAMASAVTGKPEFIRFAANFADSLLPGLFSSGEVLRCGLDLLFYLPEDFRKMSSVPEANTCYPGRLAILRNVSLTAVLKGGNIGESHNHNDLGHFSFYVNGNPVIVDLGSSEYTRQYFSEERYKILSTGAQGHNAPLFGGRGEESGENYSADLRITSGSDASGSLKNAYPESLGIRELTRSIHLAETSLIVSDQLDRTGSEPVLLELYSACPVSGTEDGRLVFDSLAEAELTNLRIVSVEKMDVRDPNLLRSWGNSLWHIELAAEKDEYGMIFRKK